MTPRSRSWVRSRFPLGATTLPVGAVLELPGRGSTYVTDTPGPQGAPAVVLLHAIGCTGLLTWFPAIQALAERFRVVTLDQRWHGRGIQSREFALSDCADDVAALVEQLGLRDVIVAGYSMGSVIAQRVWRQHPEIVAGLVLAASTDRFRASAGEIAFFQAMALSMGAARSVSRSRAAARAAGAGEIAARLRPGDLHDWAWAEFRSTSPWAVAQALAALGRHRSTPWLHLVDVPTAVVVTARDRVIRPERQRALARRIPAATMHEADAGHAGCVLAADRFVPALVEALASTAARLHDRQRLQHRLQL